jgi:2-methylcitrate dehydratase PrpD
MDAALAIGSSNAVDADDIQRIVVKTHRFASDLGEKYPQTVSAKKSSIPYCVALAVLKKRIFLDEFNLAPDEEKATFELAQNVEVQLDPEMDRIHVADEGRRPSLVEIHLQNGSVLSAQKEVAKGWPENPFSEAELEQKFFQLVKDDFSKDQASDIMQLVKGFETIDDISLFVRQIVGMEL